ncbi:hypothetical protein [Vreelandella venusta]|uniref:hypothetical protein n=1 Tax=Vreelandella venusta TaxID=44935 RepID=UPI0018DA799B|nr:hypothetical protein [Halomonas venusta]QPI63879.1 hypothetical protein IR195_18925 [Halomonas venusta]
MASPLNKLRGSVTSQTDLLTLMDDEWEALSETPRYTLDQLLTQCDSTAPEIEEVIEWHASRRIGREE